MKLLSYMTRSELEAVGFGSLGEDCLISRLASLHNPAAIHIGSRVRIDDFCVISAREPVTIDDNAHIAVGALLMGGDGIDIGAFVGVSSRSALYSASDDFSGRSLVGPTVPEKYRVGLIRGRVSLARHALVGTGCTLMPGSQLGEGATLYAHSLFLGEAEPWTIYAGTPARALKPRSRDLLTLEAAYLEELRESGRA